jgi:prepilin-type N-terminal cleavage/methylation domain-containing protein
MTTRPRNEQGFSLIESMIALGVVLVGVLGLAQVYILALNHLNSSSAGLVAREKAREAIESIHAARDARTITWDQMRNATAPTGCSAGTTAAGGGVFKQGLSQLYKPGTDGLVNSTNSTSVLETSPGPNGRLGDSDDQALANFKRELKFCDVEPGLREVTVIIQYTIGNRVGTYSLKTLISQWS